MDKDTVRKMIAFLLPTQQEEDEIEKGALRLAHAGWSLCPQFPPKYFQEIGDSDSTNEDLSKFMVNFFTSDNFHNLNELIEVNLLKNQELSEWKETIIQSKKAFDADLYNVVVPTLLTVVEGYLSKLVGTFSTKNVKMIGSTKTKATGKHAFRLDKSTWLSISAIIDDLYEKSDFTGAAPPKINRHWVLHGRHTPSEAKVDALKLFNLLGSMSLTVI